MNSFLEKLLLEKDFEALNAEEQAFVRQHLEEEEYRQMRLICLAAPKTDAALRPPARLREALVQQMAAQPTPIAQGGLSLWLGACLLIAGMAAGWFIKPVQVKEVPQPLVIHQTDTVFQVKTLIQERVRWKEKIVYVPQAAPETPGSFPQAFYSAPELESTPTSGTSLGDTPELMEFFTEGK